MTPNASKWLTSQAEMIKNPKGKSSFDECGAIDSGEGKMQKK